MAALGSRQPRETNSPHLWMRLRRERYAIMRDVAKLSADEAAAACPSPLRFAETMRSHGHNPDQWPELSVKRIGGWPRKTTPWHELCRTRYQELRALGATAAFASYYCRGPFVFDYGKRILRKEVRER